MNAVDIAAELAGLTVLEGRTKDTPIEEEDGVFAVLAPYRDGGVFAGSFSGESPWERHPGDEFVQILEGRTTLTILAAEGPREFELRKGMLIVVPERHWHRFRAEEPVTVMTITPGATEHSTAGDPRSGTAASR